LRIALTRQVSPSIVHCELTYLEREPIDVELAVRQHDEYEELLRTLGCRIQRLRPEPDLPDSVFVEDVAVVLDSRAVITRPGAASRSTETRTAEEALRPHRTLSRIEAPGTMDGGDVLTVGKRIYVGLSHRTNAAAVEQLGAVLKEEGFSVVGVPLDKCLHLKTGVTRVAEATLLLNPEWVDAATFPGMKILEVDPDEPFACNGLLVQDSVIFPREFPRTAARLEREGIRVVPVGFSELAKAEAGVTCCSVIFEA
jgi:dimethylargininase